MSAVRVRAVGGSVAKQTVTFSLTANVFSNPEDASIQLITISVLQFSIAKTIENVLIQFIHNPQHFGYTLISLGLILRMPKEEMGQWD